MTHPDDRVTVHRESRAVMWLAFAFACFLGVSRVWIGMAREPEPATAFGAYQAFAHVFMGGLGLAAIMEGGWRVPLFWSLCIVEVTVALFTRI